MMRRRFLLCGLGGLACALALPPRAVARTDFARWLEELEREARGQGISARTLKEALAGLAPIPRVLELDRRQPEGRLSFAEYRRRVVSHDRIRSGRERLARHLPLLRRVRRRYGVPERILVALWGVESDYGRFRGRFPVIPALATLAFDGRRARFFRRELLAALRILDQGHISPREMYGSWAGAMGQPQFMPTTFLAHAVDFDGDGRRDIWHSLPDVFASMARYLHRSGWRPGWRWGREVRLVKPGPAARAGLAYRAPLASWARAGVRRKDGGTLPRAKIEASLLLPDGRDGPAFLVYDNFRVLLRWNRSTHFALSVGLLGDAVTTSGGSA